ncbi:MAG: hypothetical protein RL260_3378, partial [Pseudomonadota bacterium]
MGHTPPALMLPAGAPAAARAVYRLLQKLPCGTLDLQWPDGAHCRVGHGAAPHAAIVVQDWSLFSAVLKSQQVAMQVSFIATMLPSLILSGFIFPLSNMPLLLRILSYA